MSAMVVKLPVRNPGKRLELIKQDIRLDARQKLEFIKMQIDKENTARAEGNGTYFRLERLHHVYAQLIKWNNTLNPNVTTGSDSQLGVTRPA